MPVTGDASVATARHGPVATARHGPLETALDGPFATARHGPVAVDAPALPRGYGWPVAGDPPEVLRAFDPPPRPWLPGHRGVDLAAPAGAPVRAAAPGTVAFAGQVAGRPVVSIEHPGGLRTTYEPVTPTVQAGDAVEQGDLIGHLTRAGAHCAGPCLHWGLRSGAEHYLDPLLLIGGEITVRLYPPAPGPDG